MNNNIQEKINYELSLYSDKSESIDNIIDNIYIGNYPAALNYTLLKNLEITHILVAGKDMEAIFLEKFKYKIIPLYDSPNTNITKYFEECNKFITEGNNNGRVLVHCGAGVSRSVSIVIAYLIYNYNMPYSESIMYVKGKRNVANPNVGFEKHLRNYSYEILKKL
jgi:protein-tyrosine phosphatase